ncbi:MAG TPA: transcriptional regulator MntR [Bacillota bacterium]|nr:transcriptional regulator MntR [Bacillota bacterium]
MPTPTMEDYIEQIYLLTEKKGYARVSDIAEIFDIHPSAVTKMIQKLDQRRFVHYERYRGFVLSNKGKEIGKKLVFRHELLEEFLAIIGVEEHLIYEEVEGIEHHLSWDSIDKIYNLVQYFKADKSRVKQLQNMNK